MSKKIFLIFGVLLVIVGCSSETDTTIEKTVPNVLTVPVTVQTYTPIITYPGEIHAAKEAVLGASVPGRVEKINFKRGQFVKEGQTIVTLSGELLEQAKAEYFAVEKDMKRVERLLEKGSLAQQKYDHVKARFNATEARLAMLQKNTEIKAPFSGTVVEHLLEEGEMFLLLNPGLEPGYSHASGIVRLMQLNPLKVEFQISEKEISRIEKGLPVNITVDAFPELSVTGKISWIKPYLSTTTHTVGAEARILNPNGKLKPGMYCRVQVQLPEINVTVLPREALIHQTGTSHYYVYKLDGKKAVVQPVTVIDATGTNIIVEGIAADEQVITAGKTRVSDGMEVNISAGGGVQ